MVLKAYLHTFWAPIDSNMYVNLFNEKLQKNSYPIPRIAVLKI